jgi:hypothetical protein
MGISSFSLETDVLTLRGEGQDPLSGACFQVRLKLNSGAVLTACWNGRGASGALAFAGIYTLQLSGGGSDGPRNLQSASVLVVREPDRIFLADAFIVPNPAKQSQRALLRYSVIGGMTASASLYSVAGERVRVFADLSAAGALVMDLEGLASGVYLCVVQQGLQKRVLKFSVLH